MLADVLEDAGNEMNTLARLVLQRAQSQWREIDEHFVWCDARHVSVKPGTSTSAAAIA